MGAEVAQFLIVRNSPDQIVLSEGEEVNFAVDTPEEQVQSDKSDDTFVKEEITDDDKTAETEHGTDIIEEQPEVESEIEVQISEEKPEIDSENHARNTETNEDVEDKVEVGEAAKAELLAKLIKIADTPIDSKQVENNDSKETENDENDERLEDDENEEEMMPIDQ